MLTFLLPFMNAFLHLLAVLSLTVFFNLSPNFQFYSSCNSIDTHARQSVIQRLSRRFPHLLDLPPSCRVAEFACPCFRPKYFFVL